MIQDDTKFRVCSQQCDQCLFSKNRIVSDERAEEIINQCLTKDDWFQCHKFTILGLKVCCRGFWNAHKRDVVPLRIAQLYIQFVEFINPPKGVK